MERYTIALVAFTPITSNLLKTTFSMMSRRGYPVELHSSDSTPPSLYLIDGDRFDACEEWRRRNPKIQAPMVFVGRNPYNVDAPMIPKPLKWEVLCDVVMGAVQAVPPPVTSEWTSATAIPVSPIHHITRTMLQKPRILIVDDSATVRKHMTMKIGAFGFPCDTAESPQKAFDLLKFQRYSAVFMDVMMPDMDGYEACKILRRQLKYDGPVIMVTSLDSPFDKMRAQISGSNDYITKPIEESSLVRVLELIVRKHQLQK